MNRPETRLLLHAYLDRELDLVRSLDVEKHVQACATCAAENASLRSLQSVLRTGDFTYRAPQSLRQAVRQIARAEDEAPRAVRRSWFWQWLADGAMATALLVLVLRPGGMSDRDVLANEIVFSHVRSLMAGHLTDVVSSDQHTVKPWFNGKLDFAPDVKDFAAQGFPLVGGRLDYLDGRSVAALVYRRNQHYINVFIWPAAPAMAGQPAIENRRGYSLITRQVNGLHHALVSDLNPTELGELADLIGK